MYLFLFILNKQKCYFFNGHQKIYTTTPYNARLYALFNDYLLFL